MKTLILFLLLTISAYADELMVIAPMTDGRPPVVEGADYDWSCMGRCDAGQTDALFRIVTKDTKTADALRAVKGVSELVTDSKTSGVYEKTTLKVIKPTMLSRLTVAPIEYEAALKVIDEKPIEEPVKETK
jgi:hypothetical protein